MPQIGGNRKATLHRAPSRAASLFSCVPRSSRSMALCPYPPSPSSFLPSVPSSSTSHPLLFSPSALFLDTPSLILPVSSISTLFQVGSYQTHGVRGRAADSSAEYPPLYRNQSSMMTLSFSVAFGTASVDPHDHRYPTTTSALTAATVSVISISRLCLLFS